MASKKYPWILGLILSCLFIWGIAAIFHDSTSPWFFDRELGILVHPSHYTYRHRSEGWGMTHYGAYGIGGIPDAASDPRAKILIWGDSYVAAHGVNDQDKMAQQLSHLFSRNRIPVLAVGIGFSGASMADYYFRMPRYEKLLSSVRGHFIMIAQPDEDIVPDRQEQGQSRFLRISEPPGFALHEAHQQVLPQQKLKMRLSMSYLDFIIILKKRVANIKPRFAPTIQRVSAKAESGDHVPFTSPADEKRAFAFLCHSLRSQTTLPLTMVYLPRIPRIEQGKIVFTDPFAKRMATFARICREHNIGFLNLGGSFIHLYEESGRFPRGFANSRPGQGHLNRHGHGLVAQALYEYAKKQNLFIQPLP